MNTTNYLSDDQAEHLARRVAAQLDQGLRELPHDISERLRAARTRAVAARRQTAPVLATAAYNAGPGRPTRWREVFSRVLSMSDGQIRFIGLVSEWQQTEGNERVERRDDVEQDQQHGDEQAQHTVDPAAAETPRPPPPPPRAPPSRSPRVPRHPPCSCAR